MTALQFDEASHTYSLDGRKLPAVSEVIRPISPDFTAIPPTVLERKRELGVAVHYACELYDSNELGDFDDEIRPYLDAWTDFLDQFNAEVVASEQRLHHPSLMYAGTLDRVLRVDGQVWLVDIKTSATAYPSYGAQLAGYALMLESAGTQVDRRATVHLQANGKYWMQEFRNPSDQAAFMACLSIYRWKEANK